MGYDGAHGLEMRGAAASRVAQDEAAFVGFGMPKQTIVLGAAVIVLERLAGEIVRAGR